MLVPERTVHLQVDMYVRAADNGSYSARSIDLNDGR